MRIRVRRHLLFALKVAVGLCLFSVLWSAFFDLWRLDDHAGRLGLLAFVVFGGWAISELNDANTATNLREDRHRVEIDALKARVDALEGQTPPHGIPTFQGDRT